MIVDTSVWIEFLSNRTSTASHWVGARMTDETALIVVPEPVLMELLIGTSDDEVAAARRRFLYRFIIEPLAPMQDSEHAAAIHRRCRRGGSTIRNLIDCQIAAMALRLGVSVAHRDRDFEAIAEHCGLQTLPLF